MDRSESIKIELVQKKYSSNKIEKYLKNNANIFVPSLSSRVNINLFSKKIFKNATQFWVFNKKEIIGFAAVYLNDKICNKAYITSISLIDSYQGKGIGEKILCEIFNYSRDKNFKTISLEVNKQNIKAKFFYFKMGFKIEKNNINSYILTKKLNIK